MGEALRRRSPFRAARKRWVSLRSPILQRSRGGGMIPLYGFIVFETDTDRQTPTFFTSFSQKKKRLVSFYARPPFLHNKQSFPA
jgi:hypothetical protein